MTVPVAILTGFSEDLAFVVGGLPRQLDCFQVHEKTPSDCPLPRVSRVVYVFSPDTGYSSQLLSWFTWIHHDVRAAEEYVLAIRGADLSRSAFDFTRDIPTITMGRLQSILSE